MTITANSTHSHGLGNLRSGRSNTKNAASFPPTQKAKGAARKTSASPPKIDAHKFASLLKSDAAMTKLISAATSAVPLPTIKNAIAFVRNNHVALNSDISRSSGGLVATIVSTWCLTHPKDWHILKESREQQTAFALDPARLRFYFNWAPPGTSDEALLGYYQKLTSTILWNFDGIKNDPLVVRAYRNCKAILQATGHGLDVLLASKDSAQIIAAAQAEFTAIAPLEAPEVMKVFATNLGYHLKTANQLSNAFTDAASGDAQHLRTWILDAGASYRRILQETNSTATPSALDTATAVFENMAKALVATSRTNTFLNLLKDLSKDISAGKYTLNQALTRNQGLIDKIARTLPAPLAQALRGFVVIAGVGALVTQAIQTAHDDSTSNILRVTAESLYNLGALGFFAPDWTTRLAGRVVNGLGHTVASLTNALIISGRSAQVVALSNSIPGAVPLASSWSANQIMNAGLTHSAASNSLYISKLGSVVTRELVSKTAAACFASADIVTGSALIANSLPRIDTAGGQIQAAAGAFNLASGLMGLLVVGLGPTPAGVVVGIGWIVASIVGTGLGIYSAAINA